MEFIITKDCFLYTINNFLDDKERTLLRLVNKELYNTIKGKININSLIQNGNLQTLQYLYYDYDIDQLSLACKYARIDIMRWYFDMMENNKLYEGFDFDFNCLHNTIASKNLDCIKFIIEDKKVPTISQCYDLACLLGNLPIMEYLYDKCVISGDAVVSLIISDDINNLKWFINKLSTPLELDNNIFAIALRNNNTEICEYLMNIGCPYDVDWEDLIFNLSKDTMNWLILSGFDIPSHYLIPYYSYTGELHKLKEYYTAGYMLEKYMMDAAVIAGNLSTVKWLCNPKEINGLERDIVDGCPWDSNTFNLAIQYEHSHILNWIIDNGCIWNADSMDTAILTGNLSIMKWLYRVTDENPLWTSKSFNIAAELGNIEIIKWMLNPKEINIKDADIDVKSSCPWNYKILCQVIRSNSDDIFPIMKLLCNPTPTRHTGRGRDNILGCPRDPIVVCEALSSCRLDIAKWLVNPNGVDGVIYDKQYGFPIDNIIFDIAISKNKREYMDWVLELFMEMGIKIESAFTENSISCAVMSNHLSRVQYLLSKGCKLNKMALEVALIKGNFNMIQWLLDNGCPYDDIIYEKLKNSRIKFPI
ncbi:Ankyrin-repeat protein [Orpheovirus IHUMI-LCC2]|uniref:Ankyrin-repeat protein n=1 Tax=Orpheovirus IHUMI-LCC2 TaxID=2023057 RepID=A0A2I2L4J4_9VIRU|nr:Ankyrin-repeat protein [Orpheovirus IHUMI-LCC2]SNW62431.1 Ankyrin-repeat protein [Orpheovirus IHUMI-LCC2]